MKGSPHVVSVKVRPSNLAERIETLILPRLKSQLGDMQKIRKKDADPLSHFLYNLVVW
jgi:hypothetical protein